MLGTISALVSSMKTTDIVEIQEEMRQTSNSDLKAVYQILKTDSLMDESHIEKEMVLRMFQAEMKIRGLI